MRRGLLLLIAVAAGVLGFAPREAVAYPLGMMEAERLGFSTPKLKIPPEIMRKIWKVLADVPDEPAVDGPADLSGGSMQPSNADGSGTGAASPNGLASAISCLVAVPPLVGQIAESRLLIPIRFLDGVFRPPQR